MYASNQMIRKNLKSNAILLNTFKINIFAKLSYDSVNCIWSTEKLKVEIREDIVLFTSPKIKKILKGTFNFKRHAPNSIIFYFTSSPTYATILDLEINSRAHDYQLLPWFKY